ncbi:MAG TPA: hypothetical protein VIZ00_05185 [Streptosporangiaceae bacterium]
MALHAAVFRVVGMAHARRKLAAGRALGVVLAVAVLANARPVAANAIDAALMVMARALDSCCWQKIASLGICPYLDDKDRLCAGQGLPLPQVAGNVLSVRISRRGPAGRQAPAASRLRTR